MIKIIRLCIDFVDAFKAKIRRVKMATCEIENADGPSWVAFIALDYLILKYLVLINFWILAGVSAVFNQVLK